MHEKNAAVILKKYADKIDKDSKAVFDIAVDKKRIKMHGVFHLTAKKTKKTPFTLNALFLSNTDI